MRLGSGLPDRIHLDLRRHEDQPHVPQAQRFQSFAQRWTPFTLRGSTATVGSTRQNRCTNDVGLSFARGTARPPPELPPNSLTTPCLHRDMAAFRSVTIQHSCICRRRESLGSPQVQLTMPASGSVTCPASIPNSVAVDPMIRATVSSALLRLSPWKLWCSSPRNRPPAFPTKSTGHSVLV